MPLLHFYLGDMMLTVQKFGGSSLADAQRLRRVAEIICSRAERGNEVVVVVSARGDTTDELIAQAHSIGSQPPARELDALLGCGERSSAALMAMQLAQLGRGCVSLSGAQAGIKTSGAHGDARIENIDTHRCRAELSRGRIVIVAGFQGENEAGDLTTLGRGGSDTTAVELAAALGADSCEIYSDVDGVYTADPRLVTGAVRHNEIDYADMLRLALGGSQVLHSRSVEAAQRTGVEPVLLSSFCDGGGTVLRRVQRRPAVCGVTRDKKRSTVSIVGRGADAHTLAEAVAVLAHSDILVTSTELLDGACTLSVAPDKLLPALELTHRRFFG